MATFDARQVATAPNVICMIWSLNGLREVDALPVSMKETTWVRRRFIHSSVPWPEKPIGQQKVLFGAGNPERDLSISEIARLVEGARTKVLRAQQPMRGFEQCGGYPQGSDGG